MNIIKAQHTIAELTKGYVNNDEEGVIGFDGKLDIRPPYQREFIYSDKQRDLVIDTVMKKFPLNTMYWNTKDDGSFEVLDGQQRTVSICQYVAKKFDINGMYFNNQPDDIQKKILDYPLDIYKCTGEPSERIAWFRVINVAGEILKDQEILNAIYSGPWTAEAKRYFSKTGCPAYMLGKDFMKGTPIRQDYLETVLKWKSKGCIEEYMGRHQHQTNADDLRLYYESVIAWVKTIFVGGKDDIRSYMKGIQWGDLYNEFKGSSLDSKKIQSRVAELFKDEDITRLAGIYAYVLDGKEKHLSIRAFKDSDKMKAYERQGGKCKRCKKECGVDEMQADHIKPWSKGGKTEPKNCQMLCVECNRRKSDA